MIKQILQIEAKVQDWIGHWHLAANTPIEIAEQMCMQYLQYIVKCKEMAVQAQQAKEAEEKAKAEAEAAKSPESVE